MRTIQVVGAVIENSHGEILCALRSPLMSMPNLWEFPGGKINVGEKPEAALAREINEELDCQITVGALCETTFHQYEKIHVTLHTYEASIVSGSPKPLEHSELRWVKKADLLKLNWAPADIPTVKKLSEKTEK